MSEDTFERAVQKAMEELKISKKRAIAELTVFMCGHGTVEDFGAFIHYLIRWSHEESKKRA